MRKTALFLLITAGIIITENMNGQDNKLYNILTPLENSVINNKATERPFTGKFTEHDESGTYVCKQCGEALYRSDSKFDAHCGWPSFDDEIQGAVNKIPDADGQRTEIVCSNCGGHLGHVFVGEGYTSLNTRHCVNSVSMDFVPAYLDEGRYETAILAGGCFWGVEYFLQKEAGIKTVVSGYTGGKVKNPSYQEISTGQTGHAEAVKVVFDPDQISYERVVKLFLEIHDPTQVGRQGPDVGDQYRSGIYYMNEQQAEVARDLLQQLSDKGYKIATELKSATEFYKAEDYHQDYYFKKGSLPYCHGYTKRF